MQTEHLYNLGQLNWLLQKEFMLQGLHVIQMSQSILYNPSLNSVTSNYSYAIRKEQQAPKLIDMTSRDRFVKNIYRAIIFHYFDSVQ